MWNFFQHTRTTTTEPTTILLCIWIGFFHDLEFFSNQVTFKFCVVNKNERKELASRFHEGTGKKHRLLRVGSLTGSSILFTTVVVVMVVVTSQTPIKMILKNPPPLPLSTGSFFGVKERTAQHW
jgi:hypothetical protein